MFICDKIVSIVGADGITSYPVTLAVKFTAFNTLYKILLLYRCADDLCETDELITLFLPFTSKVYDLPFINPAEVANIILFLTLGFVWISVKTLVFWSSYTFISKLVNIVVVEVQETNIPVDFEDIESTYNCVSTLLGVTIGSAAIGIVEKFDILVPGK